MTDKRSILEQVKLDQEAFARLSPVQQQAAINELQSIGFNPGIEFGPSDDKLMPTDAMRWNCACSNPPSELEEILRNDGAIACPNCLRPLSGDPEPAAARPPLSDDKLSGLVDSEQLMREFYAAGPYDPKARPADNVKAAIQFATEALQQQLRVMREALEEISKRCPPFEGDIYATPSDFGNSEDYAKNVEAMISATNGDIARKALSTTEGSDR